MLALQRALLRAPRSIKLAAQKELAERNLINFVHLMWPAVEPARKMVDGWVIEAICEHLEAVTNGDIRKLLINVPPGFMKSMLVDVFWPAWEWGPRDMGWTRYVCTSYSSSLTIRDNERFGFIVQSALYQELWGDRFTIEREPVIKIQNDRRGWKLATSVGGIGTGERGDRVIIDDPNNVKEAESDTIRNSTNTWFREVMPNRVNDIDASAFVVIQQRTHEEDVSGTIITQEMGYEHLSIPMEFDSARRCFTTIGWEDPRDTDGELAWVERFPAPAVAQLEKDLGPYAYSGQYQQSPSPRGGGILMRDWWQLWDDPQFVQKYKNDKGQNVEKLHFPDFSYILASVDTSSTDKQENDEQAITVWGVWTDRAGMLKVMLVEAWEGRLQFHALVEKIIDIGKRRKVDDLVIENKNNGIAVAQEVRRLCSAEDFRIIEFNPEGDKVARAHAVVPVFYNGLVYAPDRKWAQLVIDRCAQFPRIAQKGLVDTVTQALLWLRRNGMAKLVSEAQREQMAAKQYRRTAKPIYEV